MGSYTLSYAYNLAGELTQLTNPWTGTLTYGHDLGGRTTSVTGSGWGGVTTYASNLRYRAWGGVKQVSYGNGRQLNVGYDNRLRTTLWDVAGVNGSRYQYTNYYENGGRVTYAQNPYDRSLDRSYYYDQVGRLAIAYTGSEAQATIGQNSWGHPDGPFAHLYNYDVWGNITHREGWGGSDGSYTNVNISYSNNRVVENPFNHVATQYDASGNFIYDGGGHNTAYNAANQQVWAQGANLQQGYDGNGLRVRKIENGQTVYYLRSSVLGGQVVADLNGSGGWARGYVYMDGQLIALQQQGTVQWTHQDPVTKSQRLTDTAGNVISTTELDPWGGNTARSHQWWINPHVFTTYEWDGNGEYEAGQRKLQQWWRRFDQADPADFSYDLANPQSFNRYSYVQNDPVNFTDPSGLRSIDAGARHRVLRCSRCRA
ncbi:MAG: RHS repeat-associated core domain-containing protein [Pyrinomonadaceae bacterium]